MTGYIGLTPVPDDANMSDFIDSIIARDEKFLEFILSELQESKKTTKSDNLPDNFTYGKLLRFIQAQTEADRTHLTAIALWQILEDRDVQSLHREDD